MIKYTAREKKRYIENNVNRLNFMFKEIKIERKIEVDVQKGEGSNIFLTDLNGNRLERFGHLMMNIDQTFQFTEGLVTGIQLITIEKFSLDKKIEKVV